MEKLKSWAPWEGKAHDQGKKALLRSVTICIIITNFMIIVFGVLAASRASRVQKLTQVDLGLIEQL